MLNFSSALDKEMRIWDTYITLEATVKNMLTSLKAVGELQNPAIRERHWKQLMSSTKVCPSDLPLMIFSTQYNHILYSLQPVYTYFLEV